MVNKLNAVSLNSGGFFSRGLPHPLANIPPERLQQILMQQQRQREAGQEGFVAGGGGAPGQVGLPNLPQPGMQMQPSQQQQQPRLSMPGLPGQPQQPSVAGGAPNPAIQEDHSSTFTGDRPPSPPDSGQGSPIRSCTCSPDTIFMACSQLQQHLGDAFKTESMPGACACVSTHGILKTWNIVAVARTCPFLADHLNVMVSAIPSP
jgi:hypothetical protein